MRILVVVGLMLVLGSCHQGETKKMENEGKDTVAVTMDSISSPKDSLLTDSLRNNVDVESDKTQVADSADLPGRVPGIKAPGNGGF